MSVTEPGLDHEDLQEAFTTNPLIQAVLAVPPPLAVLHSSPMTLNVLASLQAPPLALLLLTNDIDCPGVPPDVPPPQLSADCEALLSGRLIVVSHDSVHEVL